MDLTSYYKYPGLGFRGLGLGCRLHFSEPPQSGLRMRLRGLRFEIAFMRKETQKNRDFLKGVQKNPTSR